MGEGIGWWGGGGTGAFNEGWCWGGVLDCRGGGGTGASNEGWCGGGLLGCRGGGGSGTDSLGVCLYAPARLAQLVGSLVDR